jgi:radical SAM protein with 4Fe4S-binding SPASM domain
MKSNTNLFMIRVLAGISPYFAKKIVYILQRARFFSTWRFVAKEAKNDIELFFEKEGAPLFPYVEIETINRCNGTCSFCPVNKNIDPRPLAKMSENTFKKIIDNLVKLNFNGPISYYSNNESLIDNRIVEFIKYGVSKLPNCRHQIFTNGTLLSEEKFLELIDSGLSYLAINNYNDRLKMHPNIKKIYDKYKNENFSMVCQISLRFQNQVLSNRGGNSSNKAKLKKAINARCYYPFSQLIIRADSGVSLCCNDALGKITLGNVEEQSLEDIWFGDKHTSILKSIRENMRNEIEVCKMCNIIVSTKRHVF